jgi:cell division protease FtsH
MLAKIDKEVQVTLEAGYKTALTVLKKLKPEMHNVAKVLMEKETIEAEDFIKIVGPNKLKEETGKDPEKIIKA